MSKKLKKLKFKACVAKRCLSKLLLIVVHFFETLWAIGGSVAAAMVISTPTRCRVGVQIYVPRLIHVHFAFARPCRVK